MLNKWKANEQDGQCKYNVTTWRIRASIVAMDPQLYFPSVVFGFYVDAKIIKVFSVAIEMQQ